MIHFIVATSSEARPLIDFYSLKKKTISNFVIYNNDIISLTISGIGKTNAAMSIAHTYYEFNQQKNNIWINFGIAGHKDAKIGDIFLIDKVIDNETKETKYPVILDDFKIKQKACITYGAPNFKYTNYVSDMEASGFFFACEKYSTKEFIYSIKIISDNEKKKLNFFDKEIIRNLIVPKIKEIDMFKKKIFSFWIDYYGEKKKISEKINNILSNYNLTFSETEEFKKWLIIYFYNEPRKKTNIINLKENFQTNIKNIKKQLGI